MSKRDDILIAAERLFHRTGFHATGIDRIVAEAAVSPRTLYRHFRSKEDVVLAVLRRREARFREALDTILDAGAAGTGARWTPLFTALAQWFGAEGEHGCLFLKALGEYAERDDAIARLVREHKQRLLEDFRRQAAAADAPPGVGEGMMLLLEGATALAPVLGGEAASAHAAAAAQRLADAPAQGSARQH
jgi:AcrR family transcriptional regulator